MEKLSKVVEITGGQAPQTPNENEMNSGGLRPPDPPILTGGQAPQTPRGFPRVLGTMDNRGLIHAIISLYEIKRLGQNMMSKYDVKI